jgi:hypothetical protein
MSRHNIKVMAIGTILLAIGMTWGIKNYLPLVEETESHCIAPRVIDDISKELLSCYGSVDRCNQHFQTCVKMYMEIKNGKEMVP